MVVRAIALSVALLVGVGVIVPLSTYEAEAGRKKVSKKRKYYKKYSKKWWRAYRARQRARRAQMARVRALRLKQLRLANAAAEGQPEKAVAVKAPKVKKAALPTGEKAPENWSQSQATPGELRFRVDDSAGSQVGSASITVVGPAMGENVSVGSRKMLGGVATSALRRDVINRMIQENGWVVNDYQKDINGRQVYVVEAQSQAKNGQVQSRMFYFTEVDGRIYNVATNSPADQAERLAEESEKVLASIQNRVRSTQRAGLRNDE